MVSCLGVIRFLACVAGIALSVYALHVEISKEHNKEYKALCDINEHMSCSKVFSSKYGTGFGLVEPLMGKDSPLNVPNSIFGIIFYLLMFLLGLSSNKFAAWLMFLFSLMSCAGSIYLGYILFYILHDTCVVCISTYVVNAILLVISLITVRSAGEKGDRKKKKE
ncbi:vitamin K epoxide reductase complex subunit 1 [Pocillopora verrucosa]|uniref:vitamin K epoxide reductase complex subunit 1-like n=1 Tax=Pocillopora damicornis TaxID=46731 RepID=UPI000F552A90|nr:vitamin K epoxide reductase complex subunit 1-like [Pocillopora damicornis]XP_058964019.1 vitamin K epoxide reductase complex subunit 1-like [Pocillopora verrucosa]